jgi:EAL domain-containing protein (putative c-di-GMP-specific phosphodiesterase class I)
MFEHLNREVYVAGEVIFRQGELGDCAYLIESGRVEILINKQGTEHGIAQVGNGEIFGEIALLDSKTRTATAKCMEKTVLIPIQHKMVNALLDKTDPIIRNLLLCILERYRINHTDAPASANDTLPATGSSPAANTDDSPIRDSLRGEVTQKLTLAHDISQGLLHDEFDLHYQPICDLSGKNIAGYEALIRWNHPSRGMVAPMDFLWMAESTGQILELGLWTLERACRDWPILRQHTAGKTPFISVNLSANQLVGDDLIANLKRLLTQYQIPPDELKLELTESIFINDPDKALILLDHLTALGCSLALDDYGTGYSGLNSLQRYPIATMKIDKSFIGTMLTSAQSHEIVRSSIQLAHSLSMNVVAEGIETEEVYNSLLQMKCDFGQGWYFGRPAALKQ